jgi:hypothetical protein
VLSIISQFSRPQPSARRLMLLDNTHSTKK